MNNNIKIKNKIIFCGLVGILFIVCFTTLGSIPVGPIVATTSMIPVIITSIVLGLNYSILMGFLFGLFSFIVWTFMPPNQIFAFLFTPFYSTAEYSGNIFSIINCFIPRVMIGITTYGIYQFLKNKINIFFNMAIASFFGSLTNTILFLLFTLLFFRTQYEAATNQNIFNFIIITITTNGFLEAIMCAIICPAISNILKKII